MLNYPVWRALRNDLISHLLENIAFSWALTLQLSLKTKRIKKLLASIVRLAYGRSYSYIFALLVFKLLCTLASSSTRRAPGNPLLRRRVGDKLPYLPIAFGFVNHLTLDDGLIKLSAIKIGQLFS